MKKEIVLLLFALMLVIPLKALSTDDDTISVVMCQYDPQYDTFPDKGTRMPGHRELCVIDFISKSISVSIQDKNLLYELWDEEGKSLKASYTDEFDMVSYLSTANGCCQLRIITERTTYMGYFDR